MDVTDDDRLLDELISGNDSNPSHNHVDEEDELVEEIDVVLSQELSNQLYVMQYPLRPLWRGYDNSLLEEIRYKPGQQVLEMEYGLTEEEKATHREETTTIFDASGNAILDPSRHNYQKHVVRSNVVPMKSNYLIGLYRGKELHVTPLRGVLQMRPSFTYIDQANELKKKRKDAEAAQQIAAEKAAAGIRTEDADAEAETLKPMQFQVKKKETEKAQQARLRSYAYLKQMEEAEEFVKLDFVHRDRMDALQMFEKIASHEKLKIPVEHLDKDNYLRYINPQCVDGVLVEPDQLKIEKLSTYAQQELQEFNSRRIVVNQPPPVLSMHTIRQLDLGKQISSILDNVHVITYRQLKSFLNLKPGETDETILSKLQLHAVLVKGVWVVKSERSYKHRICAARNWILMKYALATDENDIMGNYDNDGQQQSPFITRKMVAERCKIPIEVARSILDPISTVVPARGQRLTHAPDISFYYDHPDICDKYEQWWKGSKAKLEHSLNQTFPDEIGSSSAASSSAPSNVATTISTSMSSVDAAIDTESMLLGPKIEIGSVEKDELHAFLKLQLERYGVLSVKTILKLAQENPKQVKNVQSILSEQLIVQELAPIAESVQRVWCLKSIDDPVLDPYRTTIISLFKKSAHLDRKDIFAAFKLTQGKEPTRATFLKIMAELATNATGLWDLKSGNALKTELIPK